MAGAAEAEIDVAALDEDLAIERDADGLSGARVLGGRALVRHRPRLDGVRTRATLAGRHHDDLVAYRDAPASTRPATMRRSSNL